MKRLAAAVLLAALLPGGAAATTATFKPDPAFPAGPISQTTSHEIPKLDHVASVLAGRKTVVNCWSEKDWTRFQAWLGANGQSPLHSGWTFFATRDVELSPFVCLALEQALAKSANEPLFRAFAVEVLAHESAHASGIHAEDRAECQGMSTSPRAAKLLGISPADAQALEQIYRGTLYPTDPPEYRSPTCKAGLPGRLVPDTLGSAADLRPLQPAAAAVAASMRGWKNLEGGDAVGPPVACSPIASLTFERARFAETFSGPGGQGVYFASIRLGTQQEFATAVSRDPDFLRCWVAYESREARQTGSSVRYTAGHVPAVIGRLSSYLHAVRMVSKNGGQVVNHDRIYIFDSPRLGVRELFFTSLAGTPVTRELRAAKAALQGLR